MLDWIWAPRCAACDAIGAEPFCAACELTLEPLVPDGGPLAPWRFGGALASAIRRLKFANAPYLARVLAPLWAGALAAAAADAVVVPVPLHWRRRIRRGYDHAFLLARHACARAGIAPPQPLLRRIRASPPQSSLPASARDANVRDAFGYAGGARDVPPHVILVDDVITTGATIAAATRALHAAGATRVTPVALARGLFPVTSARE
ncbi:MAG TPA: hypothetical protein VGM88_25295 [Kofleriaceae bacterium]|jgi:ComF family protein